MIIGNIFLFNKIPVRWSCGALYAPEKSNFRQTGKLRNRYATESSITDVTNKSSVPNGYSYMYSWIMSTKSGGMAIYHGIDGLSTIVSGNLAGGVNVDADLSGQGVIGSASSDLLAFAVATILSSAIFSSDIIGSLQAAASLSAVGDISGALGALSGAISMINSSGSINPSAVGSGNLQTILGGSGNVSDAAILSAIQAMCSILGSGSIAANISALVDAVSTINAGGNVIASITALGNLVKIITSSGSFVSDINADAFIEAEITPYTENSPQNIAREVWNSLANEFNDPGTMGEKVNDAGSGGDPWATDIESGGYTGTTAGKKLRDALTKGAFLALK